MMIGSGQHVPAQVGFNAGDGVRFLTLPGSQTEAVLNISSTSNVGEPGLWVFRVDGDIVTSGSKLYSFFTKVTKCDLLQNLYYTIRLACH